MQNQFLAPEAAETTASVAPDANLLPTEEMQTSPPMETAAIFLAQTQSKVRQRRKRHFAAFLGLEALCLLIAIVVLGSLGSGTVSPAVYALFSLLIISGTASFACLMRRPVDCDIDALVQTGDSSAVPTLLDAFTLNATHKHRRRVLRALTILLPRMQASDAPLLKWGHRRTLNVALSSSLVGLQQDETDRAFALAILKAYEQVGDASAIPAVERLANKRPRNDPERDIQHAAQACLPLLRIRLGEVKSEQTLLRASTQDANTPDILLRPAGASAPEPEKELLRAANGEVH